MFYNEMNENFDEILADNIDDLLDEMPEEAEDEYQTLVLRNKRRNRRTASIKTKKRWQEDFEYRGFPTGLKQIRRSDVAEPTGYYFDEIPVAYRKESFFSKKGRHSSAHFLKRINNRKVRRAAKLPQRSGYKKVAEYMWLLT